MWRAQNMAILCNNEVKKLKRILKMSTKVVVMKTCSYNYLFILLLTICNDFWESSYGLPLKHQRKASLANFSRFALWLRNNNCSSKYFQFVRIRSVPKIKWFSYFPGIIDLIFLSLSKQVLFAIISDITHKKAPSNSLATTSSSCWSSQIHWAS